MIGLNSGDETCAFAIGDDDCFKCLKHGFIVTCGDCRDYTNSCSEEEFEKVYQEARRKSNA